MPLDAISHTPVPLARSDLRRMLELVRLLYRLSHNPTYRALVYPQVPAVARFDPGHDAVMMCYDFHVTPTGPRLIEVNTNAGGGLLALAAVRPENSPESVAIPPRLRSKLLQSFANEYAGFSGGRRDKPVRIAIVDEDPPSQYLYPEMQAFVRLFASWGVVAEILEPEQLTCSPDGVFHNGERVELLYNRHCDFYLDGAALSGLREAYLAGSVCLTPNPHAYGLLGDKRRLILWCAQEVLSRCGLSCREQVLCRQLIPATAMLVERDPEDVWAARKTWVFKPTTGFGSRGVLLGEKISRKRFAELDPTETLIQERVAPSTIDIAGHGPMKTDFRVYAYRHQVLGISARLYRGQVTNLRTPGGGFAPVVTV